MACRNTHSTEFIVLIVTVTEPVSADSTTDSTAAFDDIYVVPEFLKLIRGNQPCDASSQDNHVLARTTTVYLVNSQELFVNGFHWLSSLS